MKIVKKGTAKNALRFRKATGKGKKLVPKWKKIKDNMKNRKSGWGKKRLV